MTRRADLPPDGADSMWKDVRLADGLSLPPLPARAPARVALLTGATGFLGRFAARELLARTSLELVCLVRAATDAEAQARLFSALERVGVPAEVLHLRVRAVRGDVALPRLGLSTEQFEALADTVDRIYHAAAWVNWARSYEQLRDVNVLGALEVIHLALSRRAKPILFVSTIASCFATGHTGTVDEATDMVPHLPAMPLGYARSKCVAEALLRAVARIGLPVTVLRPALIAGDTQIGESNPDDLLAALVEGSVTAGMAPDADWWMDCVPVDFVAAVIAKAPVPEAGIEVLHLVHDRPRHWREFVLWLNLCGHAVSLVSNDRWTHEAFDRGAVRATRLYGYRRFFAGASRGATSRPFETYLGDAQRRVSHDRTAHALARLGLPIPPLEVTLLHRYLDHYEALGLVPRSSLRRRRASAARPAAVREFLADALQRSGVPARELRELPFHPSTGILHEIAAARLGGEVGLRRFRVSVEGEPEPLDVVVKSKPRGDVTLAVTIELAALCDPALGSAFSQFTDALELRGAHERELVVFERADPGVRRFLPRCYGTHRDPERGIFAVALEHVPTIDVDAVGAWTRSAAETVARDLGALHGVWYGRTDELADADWLPPVTDAQGLRKRQPLWSALQAFARPWFRGWAGPELDRRHAELVSRPDGWVQASFEQTRTLIHNDFSPRNLTLRARSEGSALCVFDWELATLGLPQRDLAEFLCFAVDPKGPLDLAARCVEVHRRALAAASGRDIDPATWRIGLAAALDHLLVERLPMYAVIHRFRPQSYLPRVVRSWSRLRAWVEQA